MTSFPRMSRQPFCLFPLVLTSLLVLFGLERSAAEDIPIGVTFVCNGEHIYVENCNIRDLSDNANCMVAHPDHLTPTGMNSYTYVSRGALKKLLPSCQQPTAQQQAAAKAFQKRQQDLYDANVRKADQQMKAAEAPPTAFAQPQKPKTLEERALNRCISSGRLPASCTGNSLLGAFSQMLTSVLPSGETQQPVAGPMLAGVFQGPGNWRLDFIDNGVLVNCADLAPNQQFYKLEFKPDHTSLVIDTRPKPLVLSFRADGTIIGPGPVTIDGVLASGYVPGEAGTGAKYKDSYGNLYDQAGNKVQGNANNGHTVFSPTRRTCPALSLSSKGAGVGVQTMQTDLLKTAFDGEKGPPTPPGIRMRGIFAANTGFSVQFFPESAVLGCGPDAARAYPYTVKMEGAKAVIHIDVPDRPLALDFRSDGSLEPNATGAYQVHGRVVTGQNENDDFTFAPLEQTCDLAVLAPSKTIPAAGGSAAVTASAAVPAGAAGGGGLSTPQAPLGNATLTIVSGFSAQAGAPNPLAGRPYVLLRDSYANVLANAGVAVPAGNSPYKYAGMACAAKSPDCQKISDAVKASAASAARGDANGGGSLPGVPPGTYYLMISTRVNNQPLIWGQAVQLKAGPNSITLSQSNATPLN